MKTTASKSSSNMRLVLFACLVAASLAAPKPQGDTAILRDDRVDQGDGNFNYAFELSDGTAVEASGSPGEGGAVNIRGSYRYNLPDGAFVQISYVADEGGFRPVGKAIPSHSPPPFPSAFASIAFIGEESIGTSLR
ncbi:cuticle protein AMP1A-like [Palaemon carinicauda]|uniref:cuticle protein AMP1A-like n=1 Tax=Palaemon carinicauda TaxID=392227 RepID=UPI0035B69A34